MSADEKNEFQTRGGRIAPIAPKTDNSAPPNQWVGVVQAFLPFGPLYQAFAVSLAYRLEGKRLAAEINRVNKQAMIINNAIDRTYELVMEDLEQRRLFINRFFDTVQQQLDQTQVKQMTIIDMAKASQQKAFAEGISLEERKCFAEMTTELTNAARGFGEKASEDLRTLLGALPPVHIPKTLLSDDHSHGSSR